jgi:hypothetical protein
LREQRAVPLAAWNPADKTASEDIASVAGQLADLTRQVQEMSSQLKGLRESADSARGARIPSKSALTSQREN